MLKKLNKKVDYFTEAFADRFKDQTGFEFPEEDGVALLRDPRTLTTIIIGLKQWVNDKNRISNDKHKSIEPLIDSYFVDSEPVFEQNLTRYLIVAISASEPREINDILNLLAMGISDRKVRMKAIGLIIDYSVNSTDY